MSGQPSPGVAVLWGAVASALLQWACTRDFDALLPGTSGAPGSTAASGAAGGADGGGAVSSSSGSGGTAGSASPASSTGSGGGGGAGAAGGDGGAGGRMPVIEVPCGSGSCAAPEVCCFTEQHAPSIVAACSAPGGCQGVPVKCDGAADCPPDQVCCGQFDYSNDLYVSIDCKATCDGADEIELCDDIVMPPCKFGGSCIDSDNLGPPYTYCS